MVAAIALVPAGLAGPGSCSPAPARPGRPLNPCTRQMTASSQKRTARHGPSAGTEQRECYLDGCSWEPASIGVGRAGRLLAGSITGWCWMLRERGRA